MSLNRRDLFKYGTAATLSTMVLRPSVAQAAQPDPIVTAYRALQIGTNQPSRERTRALAALDDIARTYDSTMDVTGSQLWPDLPSGPGSEFFPTMFYRLRTIAVDFATPGSALSAEPGMGARLVTALDVLYRNQYNENTAEIGNWYVYEIGTPYWLLQILVALADQLTPGQTATYLKPVLRFVANPNVRTNAPKTIETGANRADKALITVVSGALAGDADRVAMGIAAVTDVAGGGVNSLVRRVTTGDGYHTDGSFIQHAVVPYPGHYGLVLLSAVANLIEVTAGTTTQLAEDVRQRFFDAVADVYAPFVTSGAMMEPVRGRMLSRQGETGHDAGHQLTAAVVLLARNASEPSRGQLATLAAKFIAEDRFAPYLDVSDLARFAGGLQPVGVPEIEYAKELLATRPRPARTVPVHRVFPQSDRMVHVTANWSASLGVGSTRICRYESINGQNLHGWYVGDGVLYTFLPTDQGHYSDAYWPTVDATALPGTTEQDATPPPLGSTPMGASAWVGGARLDDGHGAYGLDFVSQDGELSARKSWFFTPDAVVCLGAGITCASGAGVRTVVENRNLGSDGTQVLLADGRPVSSGTVTANWLHLEGTGGYVLLDRAAVTLSREDRTGSWSGIDTGADTHGTTTPYTRRFQRILLDHGTDPANASYAYAVLPGASPWQTRAARFRVLANTADVQAVALPGGIVAASFFAAGSAGELSVSGPASVLLRGNTVAIADPTQVQTTLTVTVGHRSVDVDVAGSLGATHTLTGRR